MQTERDYTRNHYDAGRMANLVEDLAHAMPRNNDERENLRGSELYDLLSDFEGAARQIVADGLRQWRRDSRAQEVSATEIEAATILCALRQLQARIREAGGELCRCAGCDHFNDVPQLSADEIDALCDRINAGVTL